MSDYPDRFPPDAPVVPNDAWRDHDPPPVPARCPESPDARHRWNRPDPGIPRQECLWCDAERYVVGSSKW